MAIVVGSVVTFHVADASVVADASIWSIPSHVCYCARANRFRRACEERARRHAHDMAAWQSRRCRNTFATATGAATMASVVTTMMVTTRSRKGAFERWRLRFAGEGASASALPHPACLFVRWGRAVLRI